MAFKQVTASLKNSGNLFNAVRTALGNQQLNSVIGAESFDTFSDGVKSITGVESHQLTTLFNSVTAKQFDAFAGSLNRKDVPGSEMAIMNEAAKALAEVTGIEGFSLQNFKGSEMDIKAANLTLNAQSHLQTPGAEALFSTITVRYEDEGANLVVRAAGIGSYAYGNSAWQSASELRPIFGLLRTGDMFKDEVLAVHPVYPEDAGDDNRDFFVDTAIIAAGTATYPEADAYNRSSHATQFLKVPNTIPNYLALTQVPGQRPWTSTDELESNSLVVKEVLASAKLGATAINFFINTNSISNNTFGPTSQGQSSDDREVNLHLRAMPGFSVLDKTGATIGETMFAAFKTAGYEPLLNISLNGNYQRQSNELRLNSGQVTVHGLRDLTNGNVVTMHKADATQKGLIKSLTGGAVTGINLGGNVSNTSRGNFGYRIEVFDADKRLSVRRNSPVSVKYPVSADDVNQGSLDFAIQQMSIAINNQCSKKAFDVAQEHLKYITSIDGSPVVGNQQGSNVLPGQHYVSAAAVNRSFKIKDRVSSLDSADVFDNVSAVFLNEISDITAALNTKSGLAAIAEYGGTDKIEWTVVVHQNLARFLMRSGDARTLGPTAPMQIVETNFDSQIGQLLIVPKNTSTNDFINPLGGIGVNISKENIVVQGNVTRDQQDFGVVMTMPTYRHWPLNVIIGSLTIEDAHEFLGDEGLLTKLAKQIVQVEGLTAGIDALVTATEGNAPVNP
jgi:hypothetical protein